jgi:superfamily I DNA/RNA helicase
VVIRYKERLNQRLTSNGIVQALGLGHWGGLQNITLAQLAQQTVARFCQSDSDSITRWHTPRDLIKSFEGPGVDPEAIQERVMQVAQVLWQKMEKTDGTLPVTHDFYLKLWAMSRPRIYADYMMLDESQDANRLMLKLLQELRIPTIYVGDENQQIYSWRGAVNAMKRIESRHVSRLTQSFRFGHAIADAANEVLELLESPARIRGNPRIRSVIRSVKDPEAILCRTNAGAIDQLIDAIADGKKAVLQGGTRELAGLVRGIEELKKGNRPSHPELILFASYDQLLEYADTEMGQDFASVLSLMESHSADELLRVLDTVSTNSEVDCDVVISTAHKAKGREWKSVRLAEDFRGPEEKNYHQEEGNLAYVAITRAIEFLDVSDFKVLEQIRNQKLEAKQAGLLSGLDSAELNF